MICKNCGDEIHIKNRGWVHVKSDMSRCHQSQWCPYKAEPFELTLVVDTALDKAERDTRPLLIEAGLLLQLIRRETNLRDLVLDEEFVRNNFLAVDTTIDSAVPTVIGGILIDTDLTVRLGARPVAIPETSFNAD